MTIRKLLALRDDYFLLVGIKAAASNQSTNDDVMPKEMIQCLRAK